MFEPKIISVCRSAPSDGPSQDEGSGFYSPYYSRSPHDEGSDFHSLDNSRSPHEVLHHGHTGEHDNHPLNPVYCLIDSGSCGSIINLTEIHKQGLVDDKPVSDFAAKGIVRRAYDDEKLCDYIVAHGLDVDAVGIRIEKTEATIPYAYTLIGCGIQVPF